MTHGEITGSPTLSTPAEFDRLFLTLMIAHHTGAVEMAQTELSEGRNTAALAMAESIRDGQSAEIAGMKQLLAEMGGCERRTVTG